jgi:hypothetical protein
MEPNFDPDKRIRQYLKLVGLDKEIKKCAMLYAKQDKLRSNPAGLAKLRAEQEMQYASTLKRLKALRDTFSKALTEIGKELVKPGEVELGNELNAEQAFKYLNDAITYVEDMQKSMG